MQLNTIFRGKRSHVPLSGRLIENRRWGLLFISPWLIGLIIFKLAPIIASLILSLTNFFLLTPKETQFVAFKNYTDMFADPNVGLVLMKTLLLGLIIVPVQTGASILIAALLSQRGLKYKNTLRALFFLPSIIPSVAAMFMWDDFVNPTSGWLSRLLLGPLGLGDLFQLLHRGDSEALFILTSLWATGPGMLIMLGAMQGIPPEIHEAATVDGAGRIRRFFSITLPLISSAVFFTLIINLTAVLGGAILLDRGSTFDSGTSSYDTYIYFILFRVFKLGYASSLAWFFFVVMMILVVLLFVTSKRWVYFPDQER